MPKPRAFLEYWLPVLAWMALIFTGSSDTKSYEHSSLFVEPFLHWLFPHMPQAQVDELHLLIRKCAHLTEYAVLALLLVMLFAATDEFHQLFVSERTSLVSDVMIDTVGGAAGLFALWIMGRCRKRW